MRFLLLLVAILSAQLCVAQSECPNRYGAWLWYLQLTGEESHWALAEKLSDIGVKRIFVKVADGSVDSSWWPEIVDPSVPVAYHNNDMEAWAWSYNYPNNATAQAEALYHAAKHGYDGYVVDVEMQFDGLSTELTDLFGAFYYQRERAIEDGYIQDGEFRIYCTTWGNPRDHNFDIAAIDPWVDGYMPQTYVEIWGGSTLQNITSTIEEGTEEYQSLGATKPIHHLCAAEKGEITAEQVNEFAQATGSEFSIWRIPGGGVPESNWELWDNINWEYDHCNSTSLSHIENQASIIRPNPAVDYISIPIDYQGKKAIMRDMMGRPVWSGILSGELSVQDYPAQIYILSIYVDGRWLQAKWIKAN